VWTFRHFQQSQESGKDIRRPVGAFFGIKPPFGIKWNGGTRSSRGASARTCQPSEKVASDEIASYAAMLVTRASDTTHRKK